MPQYDYLMLVCSAAAMGLSTGDMYAYTALGNVVNFGVTKPDCGKAGKFGLHMIITTTYETTMTACEIWIVHGSGATPTTKLSGRYFAIGDMVAGAHFFIPCAPGLLQYASAYMDVAGTPVAGAMTLYFGPDEDGTI